MPVGSRVPVCEDVPVPELGADCPGFTLTGTGLAVAGVLGAGVVDVLGVEEPAPAAAVDTAGVAVVAVDEEDEEDEEEPPACDDDGVADVPLPLPFPLAFPFPLPFPFPFPCAEPRP
ncbi:MAG TPA: hypothetical protein VG371_03445 [Solirubrobacteraceae bacterium]|nr:hypothetical protein [Solirubrobacteraceae bacterium]